MATVNQDLIQLKIEAKDDATKKIRTLSSELERLEPLSQRLQRATEVGTRANIRATRAVGQLKEELSEQRKVLKAVEAQLGKTVTRRTAVTSKVSDQSAALKKNNKSLNFAATAAGQSNRAFGSYIGTLARGTATLGPLGLAIGGVAVSMRALEAGAKAVATQLASAVSVAAGFEQQVTRVNALVGGSKESFDQLSEAAARVGANSIFTGREAAQGLEFLALAGLKTAESIGAIEGVTDLATAGQLSMAKAADITTNILTAYGLKVEEIGRVNDILVATSTNANTDILKLGTAFSRVGGQASALGQDITGISALLGQLANQGIRGTRAGRALSGALRRLASGKFDKDLESIGVESFKTADGYRQLTDVLKDLEKANLDAAGVTKIFGAVAGDALIGVINQGIPNVEKLQEVIEGSGGASRKLAAEFQNNFTGATKQLKSAFEALQIEIGTQFLPILTSSAREVTKFLRGLSQDSQFVDQFSDYVLAGKSALAAFATQVGLIGPGLIQLTAYTLEFAQAAVTLTLRLQLVGQKLASLPTRLFGSEEAILATKASIEQTTAAIGQLSDNAGEIVKGSQEISSSFGRAATSMASAISGIEVKLGEASSSGVVQSEVLQSIKDQYVKVAQEADKFGPGAAAAKAVDDLRLFANELGIAQKAVIEQTDVLKSLENQYIKVAEASGQFGPTKASAQAQGLPVVEGDTRAQVSIPEKKKRSTGGLDSATQSLVERLKIQSQLIKETDKLASLEKERDAAIASILKSDKNRELKIELANFTFDQAKADLALDTQKKAQAVEIERLKLRSSLAKITGTLASVEKSRGSALNSALESETPQSFEIDLGKFTFDQSQADQALDAQRELQAADSGRLKLRAELVQETEALATIEQKRSTALSNLLKSYTGQTLKIELGRFTFDQSQADQAIAAQKSALSTESQQLELRSTLVRETGKLAALELERDAAIASILKSDKNRELKIELAEFTFDSAKAQLALEAQKKAQAVEVERLKLRAELAQETDKLAAIELNRQAALLALTDGPNKAFQVQIIEKVSSDGRKKAILEADRLQRQIEGQQLGREQQLAALRLSSISKSGSAQAQIDASRSASIASINKLRFEAEQKIVAIQNNSSLDVGQKSLALATERFVLEQQISAEKLRNQQQIAQIETTERTDRNARIDNVSGQIAAGLGADTVGFERQLQIDQALQLEEIQNRINLAKNSGNEAESVRLEQELQAKQASIDLTNQELEQKLQLFEIGDQLVQQASVFSDAYLDIGAAISQGAQSAEQFATAQKSVGQAIGAVSSIASGVAGVFVKDAKKRAKVEALINGAAAIANAGLYAASFFTAGNFLTASISHGLAAAKFATIAGSGGGGGGGGSSRGGGSAGAGTASISSSSSGGQSNYAKSQDDFAAKIASAFQSINDKPQVVNYNFDQSGQVNLQDSPLIQQQVRDSIDQSRNLAIDFTSEAA